MKGHFLRLSSLVFCGALGLSIGITQESPTFDPASLDPAAVEKMMREFAKLAPEHEYFKQLEGSWKTEIKSFYPNPDEPSVSHGMSTFKQLMGGRYLAQHFKGEFDGESFEGMGLVGFDKVKKKYVGVWIDSMGTGLMHTEGSYDSSTETMTETGSADSPLGKMKMKMVTKHVDDDQFKFTMFVLTPDGKENKNMEITYMRQ